MKCPHCLDSFHEQWTAQNNFAQDATQYYSMRFCICPSCKRVLIQIGKLPVGAVGPNRVITYEFVYPKAVSRTPLPPEVNDPALVSDYKEACLVLADSSKASAALSRRCLQHLLREKAKVKPADLSVEIDEVIASGHLPADLADNLDYVRVVGNFAAHPTKSKSSGEVMDVEPGEAEWNLDVVEEMMDFYFVRPARMQKKKTAMNQKLQEAGKPPLP
jgi:hypothetical protein